MKTLLLGMGNPILADDAVGIRLATEFKEVCEPDSQLDIVEECSVGGLNLLEVFRGYERAIVLDSVQTFGGTPGAWHRFTAAALRETVHLTNIHDANFATALGLGRRLGLPLPEDEEIRILAIEIQDNRTFSERMTPALEAAYPTLKAAIFKELSALLPGAWRSRGRERGGGPRALHRRHPTERIRRPEWAPAGAPSYLPHLSQRAITPPDPSYG